MSCNTVSGDRLRNLAFLSALTDTEYASLLPSIARRAYPARSCILRAGDPPDGVCIVLSGRVRLVHEDRERCALIAETFGAGELFGEMGLIDPAACPVSAVAAEDCEVAVIPRDAALECLQTSRGGALNLLRTSLERLCKAHRQMASFALTNVYTRVAQVLAANGREVEGEWHVDVGSEQIAAMVGASREMVSRVIRSMIEKRLVRRFKRRLIVIDRPSLSATAS
ncbi:MAG: Crp/Fnr family transcriptional regulator [Burkholderiales bacterium]